MASYLTGSVVRLTVSFAQLTTPADPDTITLTVKDGFHVDTIYSGVGAIIIKDAVGQYHADIPVTVPGIWSYRWAGTGAAAAAVEKSFNVQPSII